MKSQNSSALVIFTVFLTIVVGLIISSNFDFTNKSNASEDNTGVVLGSQEKVDQDVYAADALSRAFIKVAEIAKPSVVTIKSTQVVTYETPELFRYFFRMPEDQEQVRQGLGSGVIVSKDGYIVTNNHVVENADELLVTFDKKEYKAKVIGRDPGSDVAVIKIDAEDLKPVKLGDSDKLQVGEWVIAVGNPFDEVLDRTVTAGIVSAKGRSGLARGKISFEDFIQTDAAINPGNSGGALVNLNGELVGINTMIYSRSGGSVGIGFAISVNLVKNVMQQIIDNGKVSRGWLGVMIGDVDDEMAQALGLDEQTGALINDVVKESPAEDAGLEPSDIILKVDGQDIADSSELMRIIASYAPGTKVKLDVWRDGKSKKINLELGERPGEEELVSGRTTLKENPFGISVQELTPDLARRLGYEGEEGVVIADVKGGSVADKERLREGDLIKSVDRKPVASVEDFDDIVQDVKEDDVVLFRLKRGSTSFFAALRVPEAKEE